MEKYRNKILEGNCVEVMKKFDDNFIDLTLTSPPYDNLRTYKGFVFPFEEIAQELYRITKEGGIVVWVVNDATIKGSETGTSFKQALTFMNNKWFLHDTMIYQKNSATYPASRKSNRYTQIFEYMFVFSKGKPKTANLICDKPNKWAGHKNWGKNTKRINKDESLKEINDIKEVPKFSPRNNIWIYNNSGGFASKDKIAYKHPAIFPEKLVEDHILTWSNENDIIYDPFMGSGTTAKMALLNNRKFLGSEISKEYIEISYQRLNELHTN